MISSIHNNNQPTFKAGYHVYFFTNDGKRIVSDKNMRMCLHYMEAHLNGSQNVKVKNQDLIDTFKFGKKLPDGTYTGGDKDYFNVPKIRSVIDNTEEKSQGFINIVTGSDVEKVNEICKPIGISKGEGLRRAGTTQTFETKYAVSRYKETAPHYAESRAVYIDGGRRSFAIFFTPTYYTKGKHAGELKGFEYNRCCFFRERPISKPTESK